MTDPVGARTGDPLDVEALRSLCSAYAAAADGRDGEGFAALFVESGELLVPDVPAELRPVISRIGPEALRQVPDGLRRYVRTFHQLSDHRFTIVGDRATGEVQCVAHHLTATRPDVPGAPAGTDTVWYIRYHDDYVRSGAGWRFARRALHLQWIEQRPVSLLTTGTDTGRGADPDRSTDPGQTAGTS